MLPNINEDIVDNFNGVDDKYPDICTIECTVVTGFEEVSAEECRDVLGVKTATARGRVLFDVPINIINEVMKLRSIDNVNLVLHFVKNFEFDGNREKCFEKLFKLAEVPNWRKGLRVWEKVHLESFKGAFDTEKPLTDDYCMPRPDIDLRLMKDSTTDRMKNIPRQLLPRNNLNKENNHSMSDNKQHIGDNNEAESVQNSLEQQKNEQKITNNKDTSSNITSDNLRPRYRVSCYRSGDKHSFGSQEAARQFGGGINERLGWPVNLKDYQLEVILNITNNFGYVSLALTKEVLFKRNLVTFGRTNLRSTICYNMIRLAKPQIGDVIVDPMCGGGSIPLEGLQTYSNAFHMGGDIFKPSIDRSLINLDHIVELRRKSAAVDFSYWDTTKLPLRDQSVDVVVTDLPFGKRMGNKGDNRVLYLHSLVELARVTRLKTGRAVMLTHDRNSMITSLKVVHKLWKNSATRTINIGGLFAGVFCLLRSDILKDESLNLKPLKNKSKKRPLEQEDHSSSTPNLKKTVEET